MQVAIQQGFNFHPFNASELAKGGMNLALANAEIKSEGWAERAAGFMDSWLEICTTTFLAEDFRAYAQLLGLESPPSNRAFGGVISKAVKDGKIMHAGYGKTTNPKAHGTPASRWIRA